MSLTLSSKARKLILVEKCVAAVAGAMASLGEQQTVKIMKMTPIFPVI